MPWRVASWGLAASILAAALTWILQLAAAQFLSPARYAEALSLLAIFMLLAVPLVPVLLLVTREAVDARLGGRTGDIRALLAGLTTRLGLGGSVAVGAVFFAREPLAGILRISEPLAIPLLAAAVVANGLYLVAHSVLLAERRWSAVNGLPVLLGASRLVLSLVFLAGGYGVTGMLLGLAASTACCAGLGVWLARRALPPGGRYRRIPLRDVCLALTINFAFWFLVQLDLVYVNRFLPALAAAGYGAASTLGRLLVYVPSTVVHLMYPYLVAARDRAARRHVVIRMLTAAFLLGGTGLAGLVLLPTLVLQFTYPAEYAGAAGLLPIVGTMLAPFALVNVFVYVALADSDRTIAALVIATAAAAGVALVSTSPALEPLAATLIAAAVTIVAGGGLRLWAAPGPARAPRIERGAEEARDA